MCNNEYRREIQIAADSESLYRVHQSAPLVYRGSGFGGFQAAWNNSIKGADNQQKEFGANPSGIDVNQFFASECALIFTAFDYLDNFLIFFQYSILSIAHFFNQFIGLL